LFTNLLLKHDPFRDFNRTEFFDRMENVSGTEIADILFRAVTDPESDPLEPANLDIFASTLRPSCCAAFFRTYADLNAEIRDYYLSKLFQFVSEAMGAAGLCDFADSLELALDDVPQDLLATIHTRFDPETLTAMLRRAVASGSTPDSRAALRACGVIPNRPMLRAVSTASQVISTSTGPVPRKRRRGKTATKKRAQVRSRWLKEKMEGRGLTSYTDICANGGPAYNTIRDWADGKRSTRGPYVRRELSKALGCEFSEVPE